MDSSDSLIRADRGDPADPYSVTSSACEPSQRSMMTTGDDQQFSMTNKRVIHQRPIDQYPEERVTDNEDDVDSDTSNHSPYHQTSLAATDSSRNIHTSSGVPSTMEHYEPQQLAAHYASPIMNRKIMHGPPGGMPCPPGHAPSGDGGPPMAVFSPPPPNTSLSHSFPHLLPGDNGSGGGHGALHKMSIAKLEPGSNSNSDENYYHDSGFSSSKTTSAPHSHHSGSECASPTFLNQPPIAPMGNSGPAGGTPAFYSSPVAVGGTPRMVPQQYAMYHSNHHLQEYHPASGGGGCVNCDTCNMLGMGGAPVRAGSMGPQPIYYPSSNPHIHPSANIVPPQSHHHMPNCNYPSCCGQPQMPHPAPHHMMPPSQSYMIPTMPQATDMGGYPQGSSLPPNGPPSSVNTYSMVHQSAVSARGGSGGVPTSNSDERRYLGGLAQQHMGYSMDQQPQPGPPRSHYSASIMMDHAAHYAGGIGGGSSSSYEISSSQMMPGGGDSRPGEYPSQNLPAGHQFVPDYPQHPRQRLDSHQQQLQQHSLQQQHPQMLHMTRRQATEPAIVYNRRQPHFSVSSGESAASEPPVPPPSGSAVNNCKPPVDPEHCPAANSNGYTVDIIDPRSPVDDEPRSRNSLTLNAAGDDTSSDRSSPDPHRNSNRYHMGAKLETTKGRTPLFGTQPDWWGENERGPGEQDPRNMAARTGSGSSREERPMVNKSESVPTGSDRRPVSMIIEPGSSLPPDPVVGSLDSGSDKARNWDADKPVKREHIRMEIPFNDDAPPKRGGSEDENKKVNKRESVGMAFTIEFDNPAKSSTKMRDLKDDKRRSLPAAAEKQPLPKHLAQRRSMRKYGGPSSSDGVVVSQKSIPENVPVDHVSPVNQSGEHNTASAKPKTNGGVPPASSDAKNYLLSKMLNTANSTPAQAAPGGGEGGAPQRNNPSANHGRSTVNHNAIVDDPHSVGDDDFDDNDENNTDHQGIGDHRAQLPPKSRRSLPAAVGAGQITPARRGIVPYTRKDSEILSEAGTYTIDCEHTEEAAEAAEKQARLDIDKVFHVMGGLDLDACSDVSSKTPSPPASQGSLAGMGAAVITPSASMKGSVIRSRSPGDSIGTPVDKPPTAPVPRPRPLGSQPPRGLSKLSQRSASAAQTPRQPMNGAAPPSDKSTSNHTAANRSTGPVDGRKGLINQLIKISTTNNAEPDPSKPPRSAPSGDPKIRIRAKDDSSVAMATMTSSRRSQSFVRTGSVRPSRVSAPLPATSSIVPSLSPLSRTDGGRFSMRDAQGGPTPAGNRHAANQKPSGQPAFSKPAPNKPQKAEMKAWLRRKGYDPLKAAAAGKKKKAAGAPVSAIRESEPEPAFMSTRSASFHAGFSRDEDEEDGEEGDLDPCGLATTGSLDLLDRDFDNEPIEPANDSVFVAEYSKTMVETLSQLSTAEPTVPYAEQLTTTKPVVTSPSKPASLSIEPTSIQNLLTISNDLALSAQNALRNLANHGVTMPEDDQILELTTSSFGDRSVSELSQTDLPCDVNLMLSQLASSRRVFNALSNHLSIVDLPSASRLQDAAALPCSSASSQALYHPPVPSVPNASNIFNNNSSVRLPSNFTSNSDAYAAVAVSPSYPGATNVTTFCNKSDPGGGLNQPRLLNNPPDVECLDTLTIYRSVSPPEIESGRSLPASDPGFSPNGEPKDINNAKLPARVLAANSTSPSSSSESVSSREYLSPAATNYDDSRSRDFNSDRATFDHVTISDPSQTVAGAGASSIAGGPTPNGGDDDEVPSPPSIKLSGAIDQMKPFWQKRNTNPSLSATKIERI